jgi:hypothetical protein
MNKIAKKKKTLGGYLATRSTFYQFFLTFAVIKQGSSLRSEILTVTNIYCGILICGAVLR